jgi:hypothetical protein
MNVAAYARIALAALIIPASLGWSQQSSCKATAEGIAGSLVSRSLQAVGAKTAGKVLRWSAHGSNVQDFQSDRSYPPYFSFFYTQDAWFNPETGAERSAQTGGGYPGTPIPASRASVLTGASAAWTIRDSVTTPHPDFSAGITTRPLNPWAVLSDFARSSDLTVDGRCTYRDYTRVALGRRGPLGHERLLLDPKTWIPVALLRQEPSAIWGQVDVEYVWSNWDEVKGPTAGSFPQSSFRAVDGQVQLSLTTTSAALLPADSAPALALPDTSLKQIATSGFYMRPAQPDTIRVGPDAWLLSNPTYTTGAVLARDTVYLLDATTSEVRARQDSAWIAKLFPGQHPIVLVVTDLAWPHIGGVRYWVARGARVVSHPASQAFIEKLIARRWTLEPDELERHRATAKHRFAPVRDSLLLAGGQIHLYPIDGIASEGALMAWLPTPGFLWASDYIQNTGEPTGYAREVLRATRRVGIQPVRFAAEHVRPTDWSVIEKLNGSDAQFASKGETDGARLKLGRITKQGLDQQAGQTKDQGERTQELHRGMFEGRPAIISVQRFPTNDGMAIDSSMADARTLAPFRHVGTFPKRTMVLDFEGARVTGSYAVKSGSTLPIDHEMNARPYDSSLFDLVVAALPLTPGYHAHLPFYIYERGGLVWWDVKVAGDENIQLHDGTKPDAWVVEVTDAGKLFAKLWISKTDERENLRSTYFVGPDHTFTSTQ